MYSILDGEVSYDADFCKGGHLSGEECVSITELRKGETEDHLSFPYKCDLDISSFCEVKYSNYEWEYFSECQCSFEDEDKAYCPYPG